MSKHLPGLPATTERAHLLLFAACTCLQSPRLRCLTCRRWQRHHGVVVERRRAWNRGCAR